MKDFSDRIKELRSEYNLTLDELAEELNISKSTISRYENNIRIPNADFVKKVSEFFNVSSDYILGKTNIKNPHTGNMYEFDSTEEAINFILENNIIIDVEGFDLNKLNSKEKEMFAEELANQIKLIGYKYKKD